MNKIERATFIEQMAALNDDWTDDDVKRVYADYSLQAAIDERTSELTSFFTSLGKATGIIQPE